MPYLYLDSEDLPYYHESLSGKDIIKGNKEFRANVYFLDNNNNVIKEVKNKTFEARTNENRPSYFYSSRIEFKNNKYNGIRPKENFDTDFENVSKIVIKLMSIKTLKNNDDKVFELNNTLKKIKKKKVNWMTLLMLFMIIEEHFQKTISINQENYGIIN